jgi:ferredoxin-NADP reductase
MQWLARTLHSVPVIFLRGDATVTADSGLLAALSAVHVAVAVVRRHRARSTSAFNPFVLPSFLFAAVPWLWSSTIGLAVGVGLHGLWFAFCELCAPAPDSPARAVPQPQSSSAAVPAEPACPKQPVTARPQAPGSFSAAPVLAVLDEATDIKTFRLARPEGVVFSAGQFLPVRVQVDGKPHVRCYSISSAPDTTGFLEISVRRQGLVSTMLHASVRVGTQLSIGRPAGRFVYPLGDDRPLALLAGGIGITPILSMLRHAVASDPTRPVTLLYSARNRQALAFANELRVLAERHPQVRIAVTLSNDPDAPSGWRHGHIDATLVRQFVEHPLHTVFCLCGPDTMMAAMQTLLRAVGVPDDQVRSEQFSTAMAASSLNSASTLNAQATASIAAGQSSAMGQGHGGYRLRFATSGRDMLVGRGQTLLEAAECQGVSISFSCRAGVCQACRTRLVEGRADCQSSVLDEDDRAAGFVLPCVTYAMGDCVLEA